MKDAIELTSLTGDKLLNFVVEYAYQREDTIIELALPIQTVYFIANFEAEFYNGGLYQFMTNSSGRFAADTIESFRRIGAKQIAAIVREVEKLNPDENSSVEILAYLDDLDNQLHALYPSNDDGNVGNQLVEYVESNKDNFFS